MTTAEGCNQIMEAASKEDVLTMQTTQSLPQGRALTINQRNLYFYFLAHKKKHKNTPCYVPRCSTQVSRLDQYLNALVKLEQYGLMRVDRTSDNYTGWIMLDPKN